MTISEKLDMLRRMLGGDDTLPSDDTLRAMLEFAERETLAWMYRSYPSVPCDIFSPPTLYDMTVIMAVVVGYGLMGAEGQTSHAENGISRHFKYADMTDYIHRNVTPYAYVGVV